MGNFHRLAPPDVTGVDEYFMTLTPDGSGHLLLVKTDKQQEATLRMQVSARVVESSVARTLDFQLPDVPSKVDVDVDADSIEGEILGRGDEVLKTKGNPGRATKFLIDREQFQQLIDELGLRQPPSGIARNMAEARVAAKIIGFPMLVRPSFVLGGRAMEIDLL